VIWIYIRLVLIHLGFCHQFVIGVINYISSVSFAILIDGVATPFFKIERKSKQGCSLSPLLVLPIAEGITKSLEDDSRSCSLKVINVENSCNVTHLLFVDGIHMFCEGSRSMVEKLNEIIGLFCEATCMKMNSEKSMTSFWGLVEVETTQISQLFP
jgi:hypothetical protein